MSPHLRNISHWMAAHHRTTRHTPISSLSAFERMDTIEHILRAVQTLAHTLKVEISVDTFAKTTDNQNSIDPVELLMALSVLSTQIGAAYHAAGIAGAYDSGIFEFTGKHVPRGAGPKMGEPDFRDALKKIYP